ncbi:MAG: SDR family oxidoreductase [Chloroflexota bacterium]|nr:SDR family oxidoreductase [Chloroflexota bacterium]
MTGGAGYIGSVLVRRLVAEGVRVTVVDRCFWGSTHVESPHVRIVRDDVRTFDLGLLRDADAVVHLAGLSNDPTAEYNPAANWQMNVEATKRLADACASRGLRLVFGSSCSLYDGLDPATVWDEDAPVRPIGPYAVSKRAAEEHLLSLGGGWCPVIFRQATVYGWSPRLRLDLVVNTFVKDALVKGSLFLHGGGWMWRPLVGVADLADVYLACIRASTEAVSGRIFNVVGGNYQIRHLAMLVSGSVQMLRPQMRVDLREVPAPARVRDYRVSGDRLRNALGVTFKQGMLEAIDELLRELAGFGEAQFHDPRYYNIAWMTLLEHAAGAVDPDLDPWALPSRRHAPTDVLPRTASR